MANYVGQDEVHVIQAPQSIHESDDTYNPLKEQVVTSGSQESISSGSSSYEHDTELRQDLKERQLNMIAFNGTVGVGLFVNTGPVLFQAGPLGALLSYILIGVVSSSVLSCLGEMTALIPTEGPIYEFPTRFLDASVGFAVGWMYWVMYTLIVAAETTVAASLMKFNYGLAIGEWNTGNVAIWVLVVIALTVLTNLLPVRWFGELEYIFGSMKIIIIVALILLGVNIADGKAGNPETYGHAFWNPPYGAFSSNFTVTDFSGKGRDHVYLDSTGRLFSMWTAMTLVFWSYIGLEIIAVTAAETANTENERSPETIKISIRKIAIRVITLYCFAVFVISFCVPYNDSHLRQSNQYEIQTNAQTSPFVLAVVLAKIKVLPHILNAVFVWSALSAGTNGLYVASRTLHALAKRQQVQPKILQSYLQKVGIGGVPHATVFVSAVPSLIALLAAGHIGPQRIFIELVKCGTTISLIVNIVICSTYIMFLKRLSYLSEHANSSERPKFKRSSKRYPYRSHLQPLRVVCGLVACSLLLVFNGFVNFMKPRLEHWFGYVVAAYISIFLFAALVIGNKFRTQGMPWYWTRQALEHWNDIQHVEHTSNRRGVLQDMKDKPTMESLEIICKWLWEWMR